jgi:hypothetical protein
MSTKATLAFHHASGDEPDWHLYEEMFESGVVYLEIRGVHVEVASRAIPANGCGGVDVVLRLPLNTAIQLGLQSIANPTRWQSASDPDKYRIHGGIERLEQLNGRIAPDDDSSKPGTDEE